MAAANAPVAPTVVREAASATAYAAVRTHLRKINATNDSLLFIKILTGIAHRCKPTTSSERALTVYACHLCRHSETVRWVSTVRLYGGFSLTALSKNRYPHRD